MFDGNNSTQTKQTRCQNNLNTIYQQLKSDKILNKIQFSYSVKNTDT